MTLTDWIVDAWVRLAHTLGFPQRAKSFSQVERQKFDRILKASSESKPRASGLKSDHRRVS